MSDDLHLVIDSSLDTRFRSKEFRQELESLIDSAVDKYLDEEDISESSRKWYNSKFFTYLGAGIGIGLAIGIASFGIGKGCSEIKSAHHETPAAYCVDD